MPEPGASNSPLSAAVPQEKVEERISRSHDPSGFAKSPLSFMRKSITATLLGILLTAPIFAADATPVLPWETSTYSVESGVLWGIGTGTPISYRLVPTQLSWRSPEVFGHTFANGSRILFRHRLTLIASWIQAGPESLYFAVVGSPSVELWDKHGKFCLYTGSGGGAGLLDSREIKGGQGQDFTLTWFIRGGVEYAISPNHNVTAGILYQHMSNGGQTKPNPGIDALGFTFGYTWKY